MSKLTTTLYCDCSANILSSSLNKNTHYSLLLHIYRLLMNKQYGKNNEITLDDKINQTYNNSFVTHYLQTLKKLFCRYNN